MRRQRKIPTPKPDLQCPITGSPLIYEGSTRHTMDSDSFYHSQSNPSIRYARHPFSWDTLRLIKGKGMSSGQPVHRYFKLEYGVWVEYKEVKGIPHLIRSDTRGREIRRLIRIEKNRKKREAKLYQDKLRKKLIEPLDSRRILSKLIHNDIVNVQPMAGPSGILFYMDEMFVGNRKTYEVGVPSVYNNRIWRGHKLYEVG